MRAKQLQSVTLASVLLLALLWLPVSQVFSQDSGSKVLFEDDFSTYSSRWIERESPKATVAYRDDMLVLRVVSPGVGAWSVPDFQVTLADYTLETTMQFREGGVDSQAGVMVAYADDDAFLAVLVTRAGAWQVVCYDRGGWIDLTPGDAQPVARETDAATLTLRVDVQGDALSLWIDDQLAGMVVVAEDDQPGTGFGVIARAGRGYVDVAFDDVLVRELSGEQG